MNYDSWDDYDFYKSFDEKMAGDNESKNIKVITNNESKNIKLINDNNLTASASSPAPSSARKTRSQDPILR